MSSDSTSGMADQPGAGETLSRPQAASGAGDTFSAQTRRVLLGLVLAATFLTYIGSFQFQFVYDDLEQIVTNPRIQSWKYLPGYFGESVWGKQEESDYYRPAFLVWLLLNYSIFGLNPAGWHVALVLLHLLATFLAYLLARRLLHSTAGGLCAALLFGVHPAHVESVVWPSGAPDPLMAVFFFAAYLAFLRWRQAGGASRTAWMAASIIFFALALLTKEPGLMLLPLLIVHLLLFPAEEQDENGQPASRGWQGPGYSIRAVAPFTLVAAIYLLVRTEVLTKVVEHKTNISAAVMFKTWPWLAAFYWKKLFWSAPNSAFYDAPYVQAVSSPQFWAPALVLAISAALLWWWYRATRDKNIVLGAAWIVLPLLPVFDLWAFNEHDYAHDRYLYLSVFGFCLLLAVALKQLRPHQKWIRWERVRMQAAVMMLIAAVYAGVAFQQSVYWASELLLDSRGMQIAPQTGAKAVNNLVWALLQRGMTAQALEYSQQLTQRYPDDWSFYYNTGSIYQELNRLPDAEHYFARSAELIGDKSARPWLSLGIVRLRLGKPQEAEAALRKAVAIAPENTESRYWLALDLIAQDQRPAAREILQELAVEHPETVRYQEQLKRLAAAPSAPSKKPK